MVDPTHRVLTGYLLDETVTLTLAEISGACRVREERIIELVETRIPRRFGLDPIRDIQVLCPMNRGGVGARSLNIELQAALNPAGPAPTMTSSSFTDCRRRLRRTPLYRFAHPAGCRSGPRCRGFPGWTSCQGR